MNRATSCVFMSPNIKDLMLGYAKMGVDGWSRISTPDKRTVSIPLSGKVAENVGELGQTIWHNKGLFIPMPRINYQRDIAQCFFLPIGRPDNKRLAFELCLVFGGGQCLSFRFEPCQENTHCYAHVQMNRTLNGVQAKAIPCWLPESYPAFGIGSSESIKIFLYMTRSIHGHHGGITRVLDEVFKENPLAAKECLSALEEIGPTCDV